MCKDIRIYEAIISGKQDISIDVLLRRQSPDGSYQEMAGAWLVTWNRYAQTCESYLTFVSSKSDASRAFLSSSTLRFLL